MYHTLECIVFWDRALHPPVTPHFSFHICRFSHLSTEEVYPLSTLIVIYHLSMHLFYPLSTVYHLSMVKCWPIFTFVDEISPNYYICRWFIICRRFDVKRAITRRAINDYMERVHPMMKYGKEDVCCISKPRSPNQYTRHTINTFRFRGVLEISPPNDTCSL